MIASVLLGLLGLLALLLIVGWMYVSFGIEEWATRNKDERRRKHESNP